MSDIKKAQKEIMETHKDTFRKLAEYEHIEKLEAEIEERDKSSQQVVTTLKAEIDKLRAENEKLKETISYLPKVPTQPYEKELAKKVLELESKLTEAAKQLEIMAEAIDNCEYSTELEPVLEAYEQYKMALK